MSAFLQRTMPLFKLEVCVPSMLLRVPGHPVFENSTDIVLISKELLHQGVFVPELVNARHMLAGSLPNISSTLNMLLPHLHIRIL